MYFREKIIIFSHNQIKHPCGADEAIRLSLLKRIRREAKRTTVDGFLYSQCKSIKGKNFKVIYDTTEIFDLFVRFEQHKKSNIIRHLIPKDVLQKLIESKKYIKGWKRR